MKFLLQKDSFLYLLVSISSESTFSLHMTQAYCEDLHSVIKEWFKINYRIDLRSYIITAQIIISVEVDTEGEMGIATKSPRKIVLKREDRPPSAVPSTCTSTTSTVISSNPSPTRQPSGFTMNKKPILPVSVRYKWLKGFRKIGANYKKISFAKLEIEYRCGH